MNLEQKIKHAKVLIKNAVSKYENIAVACSFGKDSMVTVHLARIVWPQIPIFSIMTIHKPKETFEYLKKINNSMKLNVTIYIVADKIPEKLKDNNLTIKLLSPKYFNQVVLKIKNKTNKEIYEADPDTCCKLLKVDPTKQAVLNLDAWICGLRNTEGKIRKNYQEVEKIGNLAKINPILTFTEQDVLQYLKENKILLHPWYGKQFSDGRCYRSLGCEPCTKPIFQNQLEREGRWQDTSKCGGECGIHTQKLK